MQVNLVNLNNNSPTFSGICFHNKKRIAKLGKVVVEKILGCYWLFF